MPTKLAEGAQAHVHRLLLSLVEPVGARGKIDPLMPSESYRICWGKIGLLVRGGRRGQEGAGGANKPEREDGGQMAKHSNTARTSSFTPSLLPMNTHWVLSSMFANAVNMAIAIAPM